MTLTKDARAWQAIMNEWLRQRRTGSVSQRSREASREPRAWREGDRGRNAKENEGHGGIGVLGSSYPLVSSYQAKVAWMQEEQRERESRDWERWETEKAKDWNVRDTNPLWSDSEVS